MSVSTAKAPTRTAMPKPPSVHLRALITWIAIFPLVTLASLAIAPFATGWSPVLRSLVLSLIVVPAAVYLVVPQLMRVYGKIRTVDEGKQGERIHLSARSRSEGDS
ncbi:MAG: hypothetical protein ABI632_01580 [Pseudolysinimonas sp.]